MKILVIGDYIQDVHMFYETIKYDATGVPVVKFVKQINTAGGCRNFVVNLSNLTDANIHYCSDYPLWVEDLKNIKYYELASRRSIDMCTKTREYIDNKLIVIKDSGSLSRNLTQKQLQIFLNRIEKDDLVIISNYHKGLLSDLHIDIIINKCRKMKAISIIDTKHLNRSYHMCDILKINEITAREFFKEHEHLKVKKLNKNVEDFTELEEIDFDKDNLCKMISESLSIKTVIITKGANGYECFHKKMKKDVAVYEDFFYKSKAYKHENYLIRDTTGAGDAFLAGFVALYKAKRNLEESLEYANLEAEISTRYLGTLQYYKGEENV